MGDFVGEFFGTMILILLGDGVVAGVLLNRSKAQNSGWIVITAGWAFAVMAGVFTSHALGGPGAINPVGPVAGLLKNELSITVAATRIAGEFAGAFVGAVLVWLHYRPHWAETADAGAKLAVFCTGPAIRDPASNLISEIVGTFVLLFVADAIGHGKLGGGEPALIGGLVWGIGLSLGGTTGYAINPARDLSPRLAHAVLPIPGKGGSDWGYAWIPVVGPFVGGALGALLFKALAV
jgi:glycerol uptake facilitator protein